MIRVMAVPLCDAFNVIKVNMLKDVGMLGSSDSSSEVVGPSFFFFALSSTGCHLLVKISLYIKTQDFRCASRDWFVHRVQHAPETSLVTTSVRAFWIIQEVNVTLKNGY